MAVDDATIVAVGSAEEIRRTYPDAKMVALDGWVMPGLIEPHGHPGFAAILLSDLVVDLRPVVVPRAEDVLAALRTAVAEADGEPVFANGWDSLLQRGLPDPDIRFLDDLAGRVPLVVIHNSGHSVYFNTAAALAAGIDRTTPDPVGASFGRDAEGELTGVALEAAAVEMVVAPMLATAQEHLPRILPAHLRDLAARGIYAQIIARHGLTDHRFRLEHCGAMTPAQFERAASLGFTVSLFVDHITYWGEVLVDDLFGPEHGGAWADAGAAFAAGHRVTFHNDGWVTPDEPFRNMAVAETRTTRNGYRMPGGSPVTRDQALLAHTVNAAWQLFSEHEVGALAPGLFADFIVVDRDPVTVSSEELAATQVKSTYVAGVRVV